MCLTVVLLRSTLVSTTRSWLAMEVMRVSCELACIGSTWTLVTSRRECHGEDATLEVDVPGVVAQAREPRHVPLRSLRRFERVDDSQRRAGGAHRAMTTAARRVMAFSRSQRGVAGAAPGRSG